MSQVPPLSLSIWFCWRSFLFSLKLWCRALSHLTGPKPHKRMKNRLRNHFRFDPNVTSLRRRTRTSRGARSFWSWTPSSLVLSYFAELLHLGDLVTSRPYFRWRTWNYLWKLLQNQRHFYVHLVFSSRCWTLSLVASLIRQLPPNSKADYLVRTIWCIIDFLQLWTITMA
jgi:hypothetical protein